MHTQESELNILLSLEELVDFTKRFALFVGGKLSLYDSLVNIAVSVENPKVAIVARYLAEGLRKGCPLYKTMEELSNSFGYVYIGMVMSGEASGNMSSVLHKLNSLLSKQLMWKKQIFRMLFYPTVIFCLSMVVFVGLMLLFVPSMKGLILDLHTYKDLPILSKAIFLISDFMLNYGIWLLISSVIAFYVVYIYRWQILSLLVSIRVIDNILCKLNLQIISEIMTGLLQSHVSLIDALYIAEKTAWHVGVKDWIGQMIKTLMAGGVMSNVQVSWLPKYIVPVLKSGEFAGDLSTAFCFLSEALQDEVDDIMNWFLGILQPVLMVLLGVLLSCIILGVFLPMTSISFY